MLPAPMAARVKCFKDRYFDTQTSCDETRKHELEHSTQPPNAAFFFLRMEGSFFLFCANKAEHKVTSFQIKFYRLTFKNFIVSWCEIKIAASQGSWSRITYYLIPNGDTDLLFFCLVGFFFYVYAMSACELTYPKDDEAIGKRYCLLRT